MSSTKDIKQRIANVSSVSQIIKAMDMVASTKLVKSRRQLEGIRPMYQGLNRIVKELGHLEDARKHKFFNQPEIKNSLYLIFTSDKGLSGSYNANIKKMALKHMNQGKNEKIFVVGQKGKRYFEKRKKNIVRSVVDVVDSRVYYGSENVAAWVVDYYLSGEVQEVFVAYTDFENVLSYTPTIEKILPIEAEQEYIYESEREYEPNLETFIDNIIPLYLHMKVFRAYSESHTSEQAARMVNMDAAGKNASELIEDLTRVYNRKRQAAITQELSEIVGSANILKKGDLDDS